jgi:hypothetical protein
MFEWLSEDVGLARERVAVSYANSKPRMSVNGVCKLAGAEGLRICSFLERGGGGDALMRGADFSQ